MSDNTWRLQALISQAFLLFEIEPERALALLQEGRALAALEQDACYTLLYDYWQCDLLAFYLNAYAKALDLAVRAAAEASKPTHLRCPARSHLYRILADVYLFNDPVGYAKDIRETLNYIEHELSPDDDDLALIQWERTALEIALGDYEAAQGAALRYLERSQVSYFRMADAYATLCDIAYRRGDLDTIHDYALQGELQARMGSGTRRWLLEFTVWKAFCARRAGDEASAQRYYIQAVLLMSRLRAKPFPAFYDALCAFHEVGQAYDMAWNVREQQLQNATAGGSPYMESECRLRRCQLLLKMGQPIDTERAAARSSAQRLLQPAAFLAQLDRLQ